MLTMYACTNHKLSEAPFLEVPAVSCAATAHSSTRAISSATRLLIFVLLLLLVVNIFWTNGFERAFANSGFAQTGETIAAVNRFDSPGCARNRPTLGRLWLTLLTCVLGTKDRSSP